jgi:hypothetical protein
LCDEVSGWEGTVTRQPKKAPENWAQARARIDRGATGDKIANPDPAAAPLGTDAEAGGAATAGEEIARSARQETPGAAARARAQAPRSARRQRVVPWLAVSLAIALAGITALLIAT